jgi:hypothetical protein
MQHPQRPQAEDTAFIQTETRVSGLVFIQRITIYRSVPASWPGVGQGATQLAPLDLCRDCLNAVILELSNAATAGKKEVPNA